MKNSSRNILFVLLCITTIKVCANDWGGNFDAYLNTSYSPQVENMIRYGDVETSLFTGTLNFSIPIYSLKDPDFNLDIVLRYSSDAFKPCKHSGWVGYNWCLSAGGCITREVRGYPDEAKRKILEYSGDYQYSKGMYIFAKETSYNKDDIFSQNSSCFSECDFPFSKNVGNACHYDVDYLPDVFHFNFLGHHGSFMINNQGNVQIIDGDYVNVDLSKTIDVDYTKFKGRPTPLETSQITITTKDGYKYEFGGNLSALEYTYALKSYYADTIEQPRPTISSWYLTKVTAPNGRTITYSYISGDDDWLIETNMYYDVFALTEENWAELANPFTYKNNESQNDLAYKSYVNSYKVKYSATKTCVLKTIQISGEDPVQILFKSAGAQRLYRADGFYKAHNPYYILKTIQVKSNNRIIRSADLSYGFSKGLMYFYTNTEEVDGSRGYFWQFLSKVKISGEGTYELEYNHKQRYPILFLEWNDDVKTKNKQYCEMIDSFYGYWLEDNTYQGMLREVRFPTGGRQEFTYEKHDYGTERRFSTQSGSLELCSKEITKPISIGGARIKNITTYDENGEVEKREYRYKVGTSNKSSGVYYNNWYVYENDTDFYPMKGHTCSNRYSLFDTHIGYSEVEEKVLTEQGVPPQRTIYAFNTGTEFYSPANDPSINKQGISKLYYLTGMLTYDNNLNGKGKLLSQKYYEGNKLIRHIQRTYNGVPLLKNELIPAADLERLCTDTIVVFSHAWYGSITRKLFIYPDVLTREATTDFSDGAQGPIITQTSYSYDKKLRVTKETIVDSRDIEYFKKYTYPDNVCRNTSDQSPLSMLVGRNRINTPIETISGYVFRNDDYITSGSINIYAKENENGHTYPYLSKTLSLAMTEPIEDYKPMRMDGSDVTYDSRYKLDATYKFDKMNRLTSIKPFGLMETKYTWNGIYPATKTIGNQIWKYSFIPYVGVNQITDPRGITTYYEYDEAGRLIEEYQMIDGKKQILNIYQYHIKTEE